jgi:DNA helicase HerA-like ATPase
MEKMEQTEVSSTNPQPRESNSIELQPTDRILILGDSGSGKTVLAQGIAKSYKRLIVVSGDPKEFGFAKNRVETINPETTRTTLSKSYETGNAFVVIDDTDNFFTRFENDERVRTFLILGRHRNIGWSIIARRPTDLPPLVFTQANKIFVFQTDHPRELKLYEQYVGVGTSGTIKSLNRLEHQCFYYNRDTREQRVIKAKYPP